MVLHLYHNLIFLQFTFILIKFCPIKLLRKILIYQYCIISLVFCIKILNIMEYFQLINQLI